MVKIQNPSKVACICGFLAPVVAFGSITISILMNPWFSFFDNALSDLGNFENSNSPLLFNTGLILAGILGVIFVAGIGRDLKGIGRLSFYIILSGLASLIGIGLFPDPTPLHVPFSVLFFILIPIGLFLFGIQMIRSENIRWGTLSILLGIISGAAWTYPYPGKGVAIPETISALCVSAWSVGFSFKIFLKETLV